jgi:hypothetical protein
MKSLLRSGANGSELLVNTKEATNSIDVFRWSTWLSVDRAHRHPR